MSGGEAVKVVVRCRPLNKRELGLNCKVVLHMDPAKGICSLTNPDERNSSPKDFTFDGVYYIDSTTEALYNQMVYPLVENCLEGYNGTVFAYGQTGSGKSFSMQGPEGIPAQRGVTPRTFEHIFEATATTEDVKFLVHASFLEIYNEEVRDLLGTNTKAKLDIKEHPEKGIYVAGLSLHAVHNIKECEAAMEKGLNNRSVGATLMNADSSRSHSIFSIYIEMMETKDGEEHIKTAKLHLVDLAGSERQGKTGATGDRLKEANKINLSLSALGNVISALVDGKAKHIPYRDSKLTRLLQDSLGGNTKTIMLACMSPADNNYDETISTLRYANRAKNIKNKPIINEDPKDALLRQYQEEIQRLKEMLSGGGGGAGAVKKISSDVVLDTAAIEEEKQKLREEYEAQVNELKSQYNNEKTSNEQLQEELTVLKKNYTGAVKYVQETHKSTTLDEHGTSAPNSSPTIGKSKDIDPQEALQRLELLQQRMVGGEQVHNEQLKEKRKKKKGDAERRREKLADALSKIDADDPMMRVYDNIQEKLEAVSRQLDREKRKTKTLEKDIQDLHSEFELDRIDYLDTIRRQDQQLKLMHQMLEKIQPTIRRDSNYSNIEKIKKEAVWDDDLQRWHIPDVTVIKTQLPTGGIMPGGRLNDATSPRPTNGYTNGFSAEEDRLKMKLHNGSAESIANSYFKPVDNSRLKIRNEHDKHKNDPGSFFPNQQNTWDSLMSGVIYTNDIYEQNSYTRNPSAKSNNSISSGMRKPLKLESIDPSKMLPSQKKAPRKVIKKGDFNF